LTVFGISSPVSTRQICGGNAELNPQRSHTMLCHCFGPRFRQWHERKIHAGRPVSFHQPRDDREVFEPVRGRNAICAWIVRFVVNDICEWTSEPCTAANPHLWMRVSSAGLYSNGSAFSMVRSSIEGLKCPQFFRTFQTFRGAEAPQSSRGHKPAGTGCIGARITIGRASSLSVSLEVLPQSFSLA